MNTQFSQTAVLISQHIYNAVRRSVIPGGNLDSASAAGRMDNLPVADIHGHMAGIADRSPGSISSYGISLPNPACSPDVLGMLTPKCRYTDWV